MKGATAAQAEDWSKRGRKQCCLESWVGLGADGVDQVEERGEKEERRRRERGRGYSLHVSTSIWVEALEKNARLVRLGLFRALNEGGSGLRSTREFDGFKMGIAVKVSQCRKVASNCTPIKIC